MMARIGRATPVCCYSEDLCMCPYRHRLWPYAVRGSDIFQRGPKRGFFIAGVWFPDVDRRDQNWF